MAEITAAAVKALRDKTGLPMMECKKALQETGGDEEAAIEWLRKDNGKVQESRVGRETAFGRMGVYADWTSGVGAMVELQCESAPVAGNEEFVQLADDLAKQLATGPGRRDRRRTARAAVARASPARRWASRLDDLINRIREVFRAGPDRADRRPRAAATPITPADRGRAGRSRGRQRRGGQGHLHAHRRDAARRCWPRRTSIRPTVDKEREILAEAARKEGKPENIIDKMVEGRLRNFYAERVPARAAVRQGRQADGRQVWPRRPA